MVWTHASIFGTSFGYMLTPHNMFGDGIFLPKTKLHWWSVDHFSNRSSLGCGQGNVSESPKGWMSGEWKHHPSPRSTSTRSFWHHNGRSKFEDLINHPWFFYLRVIMVYFGYMVYPYLGCFIVRSPQKYKSLWFLLPEMRWRTANDNWLWLNIIYSGAESWDDRLAN